MTRIVTYLLLLVTLHISQNAAGQVDSVLKHEDSNLVVVKKLDINSPHGDFAPFRHGNTLYFVSGRVSQLAVQYSNENNDTEITDIYAATIKSPKKINDVRAVERVNTRYHEGPLVINRKGNRMYLTSSDIKTKRLKLYVSDLVDRDWSEPSMLPFCSDTFSYCHPALSLSEDTLYFSTNCCGQGKMDISYTVKKGETWSSVTALGDKVNSKNNELFPFIDREGRMCFASDRPGGPGGLDLYRCLLSDSSRGAYLLDPPLNSAADDFGIWTDSTGQSGYFSSNRSKRSGDDIYYFGRAIPDFTDSEVVPAPKSICYEFIEENSPEVSDTIKLVYYWSFGDGDTATGVQTEHCYKKPGTYNIELNVVQSSLGYADTTVVEYQVEVIEPDHLNILSPDTVSALSEIKFSSDSSKLKGYEIKQRYWSFGDGFFNQGTGSKHVFRKEGKYTVQLWVVAARTEDRSTRKFKMSKEIIVVNAH